MLLFSLLVVFLGKVDGKKQQLEIQVECSRKIKQTQTPKARMAIGSVVSVQFGFAF